MIQAMQGAVGIAILTLSPALAADDGDASEPGPGPLGEVLGVETGPPEFHDIPIDGLSVERLTGSPIRGADGQDVGEVADVLIIEGGPDKIVAALDGMLGTGLRRVLLPLGDVSVEADADGENLRVVTALTAAAIDKLAPYDGA